MIATFKMVDNGNTINDELKLIIRITDVEVEVTKVEILIDKFHLPAGNVLRGIKELYLYEDSNALDPSSGNDPNNFLSPDLIASTTVIGEVYPGSDIKKLYDGDDINDGFLIDTDNTNMSNVYHRLTFNFNEKVNLKKIAIRGRQMGGYQGFYFIIRDESNHILYVQRANVKASGTDADATSTYSFVPSYGLSRYPISDFDIRKKNNNFTLYENSTNFFLIDNLHVTMGYEYERGFVKFSRPGADIEKFNTNNVFFIYNQLMGLSLKNPPDFEMPDDADNNNIYELGTITITNVDGGRINFPLSVRTLDLPSTITLNTNAVSLAVDIYTSNIIENLLEFVDFVGLGIDPSMAGDFVYNYRLAGDDANYFWTANNTLKTVGDFGFRSIYESGGEHTVQIKYIPDDGNSQTLNVTVRVVAVPEWVEMTSSADWPLRRTFQAVVLTNDDILVVGGYNSPLLGTLNDIWLSSNEGISWNKTTSHNSFWFRSYHDRAVILTNNDLLVMNNTGVWQSSDGGRNANKLSSIPNSGRVFFETVVLKNNHILIMGGTDANGALLNDIWSSDDAVNWNLVTSSAEWLGRINFQAVVLSNDDILIMGGYDSTSSYDNRIWLSKNGGRNWTDISSPSWLNQNWNFQAVVLTNNVVVIHTGDNNTWRSKDGGTNWSKINTINHFHSRIYFQAVATSQNNILVLGGQSAHSNIYFNDVWRLSMGEYNKNY